jgi:hypothetical protein
MNTEMNSNRKNARIAGVLWIIGTVAGVLSLPFLGLLDAPDYMIKITENQNQVLIGALLVIIMAFACSGIAIWLYPVLKKHNEALALWSVGFRLIEAVFFTVATLGLLSLLTLSHEYVKAGAPDASYFQTLGTLLLAVHDWASNVLALIAFCLGALIYYYIFYRSKLIPRWLSGWGLIAILLHLAAGLLIMFGLMTPFSTIQLVLALPILLQEMVIAVWLIVKGFNPAAIAAGSAKVDMN